MACLPTVEMEARSMERPRPERAEVRSVRSCARSGAITRTTVQMPSHSLSISTWSGACASFAIWSAASASSDATTRVSEQGAIGEERTARPEPELLRPSPSIRTLAISGAAIAGSIECSE